MLISQWNGKEFSHIAPTELDIAISFFLKTYRSYGALLFVYDNTFVTCCPTC